MKSTTMKSGQFHRTAEIGAVDVEKRTVDLVFTTGEKGPRFNWLTGERFFEELAVDDKSIRMQRLQNGAPLLDTHGQWQLSDVIGVVERAWVQDGKGHATVRFSKRQEVEPIFQDVVDRVIRNVSVGYRVWKFMDVSAENDKQRTLRAVDWEPTELSLVPVGFDAGAQVRSADEKAEAYDIEIIESRSLSESNQQGEEPMTTKNEKPVEGSPEQRGAGEQPQVDLEAAKREAAEAAKVEERKRAVDIRAAVRAAKLEDSFAEELVTKGTSVDEARKLIIDKLADKDEEAETRSHRRVEAGDLDEIKTRRDAMANAIECRFNTKAELTEPARLYRHMTLVRMCEEILGSRARGMSRFEIAERAMGTSDLPLILAAVAGKTLRAAYGIVPQTFRPIVTIGSLPDYKEASRLQLGDAPALEEVSEHGEYTFGDFGEAEEKIRVLKYGKIIAITEEMIVNDDLSALSRLPRMMGDAAARLESKLFWDVFLNNPTMADSTALFHADHGNLAVSGAAISETTLNAAEVALRAQTTLDGEDNLDLQPAFLIVGPAKKTEAKKLLTSVTATKSGDVNVYQNSMDLIVENRITGNQWFVSANPSQIDTIEMAYLDGMVGPQLSQKEGFLTDGIQLKVKHVVGVKAIDHRGLYKNSGN